MCYSRQGHVQGGIKNQYANYYHEAEREDDDKQRSQYGNHH